jgi:hypothetical protein
MGDKRYWSASEFPPYLLPSFGGIPLDGGRVQSISVNPRNNNHIIVANQFGGLWKTEDGGDTWIHLDNLSTLFAVDVAYGADGKTVIATLARDNRVENGGGIWVSRDGGINWSKPITGIPPKHERIPDRISAYGISYAPDNPQKVYVGTDYGVATSKNNGDTWSHEMIEVGTAPSPGIGNNSMLSILALPKDKVIALNRLSVFFKDGANPWKYLPPAWYNIFYGKDNISFKNIDVSPIDDNKVFIYDGGSALYFFDLARTYDKYSSIWDYAIEVVPYSRVLADNIAASFVRVSKSSAGEGAVDIWVGAGVNLLKSTWNGDIDSRGRAIISAWTPPMKRSAGIHENCGYLGLDNSKKLILYGSSGGLFKPTNKDATVWTRAAIEGSGLNSYLITDLAGTNVRSSKTTSLYIATKDNGIWASSDGGISWPNNSSDSGFSLPNNECLSGYSLQVMKDAESNRDVMLAYGKYSCGDSPNMFSSANLASQWEVPDLDTAGNSLSPMKEAFFISPGNWIRYKPPPNFNVRTHEIYVSQNNGSNWRKKADVDLQVEGVFLVSGLKFDPVIYAPFRGLKIHSRARGSKGRKTHPRTLPIGDPIIGLIKLTRIFDPEIQSYDDSHLIYLPDNGSLGLRATGSDTHGYAWHGSDWHAIFGVDPRDPNYIIAPDVYNQVVKVSYDGAGSWTTDKNLTDQVTQYGSLLLYDGDPYHTQVTQISFDPYNDRRIFIGTRDAGIVVSEDRGRSWSTVADSERITYITGFFFTQDNSVIVSSYGRGLWKLDRSLYFPFEWYCPGDCIVRDPFKPAIILEPIDWIDKDVIIFLNGRINGLVLSNKDQVKRITVTPGTVFERYPGKTQDYRELDIVESENGKGFQGLKGCLAAIENGEVIKAIILKENKIFGIISGQKEYSNPQ